MAVGVAGLGYVGLPLVKFAEAGERVVALDVDPRERTVWIDD